MSVSSRSAGRPAAGFTLIEVLLALVLSTALLAGLWAALEISLRMFESGRTRVEEAQVARALLNQLDRDLRQVVGPLDQELVGEVLAAASPSETGAEPETSSPGEFASGRPSRQSAVGILPLSPGLGQIHRPSDGALKPRGMPGGRRQPGLIGSAYELRVDVCRVVAQGPAPVSIRVGVAPTVPELRTVYYLLARALPSERRAIGAASHEGQGLVRYETSWLDSPVEQTPAKVRAADATSQDQMFEEFLALEDRYEQSQRDTTGVVLPQRPQEDFSIAPEVMGLEFRYFDGAEWLSSWDSEAQGALPVAVELVLVLPPTGNRRNRAVESADESLATSESLVIPPTARLVTRLPLGRSLASGGAGDPLKQLGAPAFDPVEGVEP